MPARTKPKGRTTPRPAAWFGRFRAWLGGRTPEERRFFPRALRWALVVIPAGFLLLVLLFGAAYATVHVPSPSELAGAHSTLVLDRRGRVIARLHAEANRTDVPAQQIPGVMRNAALAAEDHNFYHHGAVSLPSIIRAGFVNLFHLGVRQGGSTITQQYVKNAYVGTQRTLFRKVKEAIVAIKLERKESKDQILTDYLNTIYFGRGAYGIEAAARTYFGISARSLKLDQAALLAGIIRAPELLDPIRHPDEALQRRNVVLGQMAKYGFASADQVDAAQKSPLGVHESSATAPVVGPYFVEDIRRLLVAQYGAARVYRGGLIVRTTLDLTRQKEAEAAVRSVLDKPTDPEAAVVSVDTDTGEILAMVGGRKFSEQQFNLASQGHRQPGSAFKPFVLSAALQQDISVKSTFRAPASITLKTGFEPWKVTNYDKKDYGTIDLLSATEFSVNTVYAQLVLKVGPDAAAQAAKDAGITSKLAAVPSITLGTSTVTPVELAGAYADFANGGTHIAPHMIRSITDAHGGTLFKEAAVRASAFDPKIANTVAYALTQVVQKGTGQRAQLPGRPVGGKTGTTENHVDAWFCGFTRQLATVVWMGYPKGGQTMEHVRGIAVTGGSFPAMIWKAYMEKAVEGTPVMPFGSPTFGGETVSPSPTTSPSPSTSPTAIPSVLPSKTPEPQPSPTKTGKPKPSPSPSPSPTGAST